MGRTFIRQDAQIRNSVSYDDTIAPTLAAYETNPTNIETDLNNVRSMLSYLKDIQAGNWYDVQTAPSTLEAGTLRGVDDLNDALHLVEKKRILRDVYDPGNDVTVTAAQNWQILALGELPTNTTAAVGSVTTLGTVSAFHAGTFGTHALDEVSGTNALNPKNLCIVTDASTGDPVLSAGRTIYALFQVETNTDGQTLTGTTPNRAQLSFVRPNATFDDLEACPVADIATKVINYATRERVRLEDLTEQDFLKGAVVDVPAGSTPTRQTVYDNQGTTPVDLTTNATLDLEGAGLVWAIRDDLEANLFVITEGSAGGTSTIQIASDVDTFDVNAVVNDFLNGASFDTGAAGTTIDIGVTAANQITSGGAMTLQSAAASILRMDAGGLLEFGDTNEAGSTWATPLVLSDSSAEWDTAEVNFGEVSLLSMINQAYANSGRTKGYAVVTVNTAADTDLSLTTAANLDADLPDYSGVGTFVDDVDVYLNGELLRNGADAAANHDVYPGTTPSIGQIKLEFNVVASPGNPDQLCMIVWNS